MSSKPFSDPGTTFSTFVELLRWRASHEPDRQTYTFLADTKTEEVRLSNKELDQEARKIACLLQSMGAAGERALLLHPPGPEYLAALYGCLYAGVVAVPAYPPRLNRSALRISTIVDDAQATLALTTTPILSKIEGRMTNVPGLGSLKWLATDDLEDDLATGWRDPAVSSETLAALQYTSGSTSAPKGVMLTHGNMLHNSRALRRAFELSTRSRGVLWLPPYHDMGLFMGLLQPLYSDFPMVLMPPVAFVQDPLLWLQTISRHRATFSGSPDFAYALCVHKIPPEQRKTLDLSSWDLAVNGAEPVNVATLEQFEAAFGPCGFRREAFYPAYGLAEASLIVSGGKKAAPPVILSVQRKALENNLVRKARQEDRGSQTLVGCGEVAGDQRVAIADPQSLTECRPNQVGEIWVSGPSVAQGYWNRPEATRRDFSAYLAGTEEGPFLRTGDLGFFDDGELFPTGRLKDLLIIRGGNFYPQDIESVAEQSHPALRPKHSAAFTARIEDEEQLVVVCEVERTHRKSLDTDEAVRRIRRAVAEQYELQVYAVVLARPGSIPQTSSGKVQRRTCKEMFLSGSLETLRTDVLEIDDSTSKEDGLHEPVSTEVAVAGIWADVLNLEEGDVHRDEDFFDIGGHSLAAAQVMARISLRFGVELLPDVLFDTPTVAGLALAVTQAQAEAEPDIDQLLAKVEQMQGRSVSRGSSRAMSDRATRIANLSPEQRQLLEHELQERAWTRADEGIPVLPRYSESGEPLVFPLSSAQQRLWFRQFRPGSNVHSVAQATRLRGLLDVAALETSLRDICVRHEALRTTFSTRDGGEPVQIIGPSRPVPLTRVDLRELPPPERKAEAKRLLVREARRPFDLSGDLMLRATLLRLDDEEHMLLLLMHHIASDGWSVEVLARELSALYNASRSGGQARLPELPVQYVDYVVWQQQRLQNSEALRLSMEYWKKQLAEAPTALVARPDRSRPPGQTLGGAQQELRVPASLVQELHALCRRQNVTLFMTLLAAWATLLHRYFGKDDILIRAPIANRNRAEIEGLIGLFSNVLVLRHDLAGDPSFAELLGRVRETALDAFSHGELPFEELIEMHRKSQVEFALLNTTRSNPKLDGLQVERIRLDRGRTASFLTLVAIEGDDGLTARLVYNPDLFEDAAVSRMLGHLRTLLESIVAEPEQRISELPLPAEAERPAAFDIATDARRRGRSARPARAEGRSTRFRKRLRRVVRRARKAAGQIRARIKSSPFFG